MAEALLRQAKTEKPPGRRRSRRIPSSSEVPNVQRSAERHMQTEEGVARLKVEWRNTQDWQSFRGERTAQPRTFAQGHVRAETDRSKNFNKALRRIDPSSRPQMNEKETYGKATRRVGLQGGGYWSTRQLSVNLAHQTKSRATAPCSFALLSLQILQKAVQRPLKGLHCLGSATQKPPAGFEQRRQRTGWRAASPSTIQGPAKGTLPGLRQK